MVGQDGLISFLEVNTARRMETHRGHRGDSARPGAAAFQDRPRDRWTSPRTPPRRGHSFSSHQREDAGRGFCPAPRPGHQVRAADRPGFRWTPVWRPFGHAVSSTRCWPTDRHGATRDEGLARSRRALAEYQRRGPGHGHPVPPRRGLPIGPSSVTAPSSTCNRWIETEWDNNRRAVHRRASRWKEEDNLPGKGCRRGGRPSPGGVAARRPRPRR
jgi:acetyl-CoA/propionyl-CoA carboxylase biotin carboxyl carrier protein